MLIAKVNGRDIKLNKKEFKDELDISSIDVINNSKDIVQFYFKNKLFEALILKFSPEEKSVLVKIKQNRYLVELSDKYDALLKQLGIDLLGGKKHNNIKAPMPGLVLKLMVKEGDQVKKGDPLIILEAMKMENILKSPTDTTIKKIPVNSGNSVEKNQVLIEFS